MSGSTSLRAEGGLVITGDIAGPSGIFGVHLTLVGNFIRGM